MQRVYRSQGTFRTIIRDAFSKTENIIGSFFVIQTIRQKKSNRWKERPANELSENEVNLVLQAIKNHEGYPKLRELASLVPALNPFKLNLVIKFLERNGTILIDGDGDIVWSRGEKSEMSALSDVAELSPEFKDFLKKNKR